jgi:DNA-binding CsgD family transcriptional regulator
MNKHYENIHRYDFLTKEIIEEEYLINGLSDAQIAQKFNMPSKTVVWRKRKKFGIQNRNPAKSNKHAVKNRQFNITKEKAIKLLEDGQTYEEIATYMGCSIIVAKRRFRELGLTNCQDHVAHYEYWDVELTDSQKQLLIGSILGDGTIARQGAYSCSHSVKQADYHKHKREALASIHSGKFQHATHKAQGVNGEHHESLHFTTGCNEFCSKLRQIYYPSGKKIFPYSFLMEQMNAEALAYWYMDDGTACWDDRYKSGSSGAMLITLGYTGNEQLSMQKLLSNKFKLASKLVYREDKNGYVQKFPTTETPKLFDLIRPYIVPSMMYKIMEIPK